MILDYANTGSVTRSLRPAETWILASAIALSALSLTVVLLGAEQEPYVDVRWEQAAVQVGGALIVTGWWLAWIGAVILLVCKRMVRLQWLLAIVWAAICLFYLLQCTTGYIADILRTAGAK